MKANDLLALSFSEPMQYINEKGEVRGSQRVKDERRLKEIAKYIDSVEMAFPNSIILAANYTPLGAITKDTSERWEIVEDKNCNQFKIRIPKQKQLAAVIDGQHRLNAFQYVSKEERFTDLQLTCSVYFDIPNSYQAFLFATINSNQKKVDRSLALEQFGYNVGDEAEKAWTPEKFAVFLSRKLNTDKDGPLYQRIKVAPLNPENLFTDGIHSDWVVSTATIVDGINSLITSNPKRDRIEMQQRTFLGGRERSMLSKIRDYSPLRQQFIDVNDQFIYDLLIKFFKAVDRHLWVSATNSSYIKKTVGVQACFDIMKMMLKHSHVSDFASINFGVQLRKAAHIDFSDSFFQASGIGRNRIKNAIAVSTGILSRDKLKKEDVKYYEEILSGSRSSFEAEKSYWQDEAENAIMNALEESEWNFQAREVRLYTTNDYDAPMVVKSYEALLMELERVAELAFVTALPSDQEFADEQRERFDGEALIANYLSDYEDELTQIGWE